MVQNGHKKINLETISTITHSRNLSKERGFVRKRPTLKFKMQQNNLYK